MTKINCLIVDDEPIARDIVAQYCAHFPELDVIATCEDAMEARTLLQQETIDLLFLDINMPVLSGMAFVKTLKNAPVVVFTTAYKEFAHEAFDISACDYLLKPFSLERFMIAVDKAKSLLIEEATNDSEDEQKAFIFIKAEGKLHKVSFEDVLFGEAQGNNVSVVTTTGKLRTTMTFNHFEALLHKNDFLKVHRSFILNKNKIEHIYGNRVVVGSFEVPIGSTYKEDFFREIGIK